MKLNIIPKERASILSSEQIADQQVMIIINKLCPTVQGRRGGGGVEYHTRSKVVRMLNGSVFKRHSKSVFPHHGLHHGFLSSGSVLELLEPSQYRTNIHDLNTGLVRSSDPACFESPQQLIYANPLIWLNL